MRHFKSYLSVMIMAAAAMWSSCSDNFDTPPLMVPQASRTANISIADFKAKYWQDPVNYIDTVREDLVIAGRVVSSDASGNIYKSLVIQDATAAIAISLNGNSLYNTYRIGQEVVISLQDIWVGKYNSLQQLGYPQYYESGGVWEATFMPLEMFQAHAELNGLPSPADIDTIPATITGLSTDAAGLRKWQSQLVKFDDVKFTDADGQNAFVAGDATTNRTIEDAGGNTIVVRTSNYSTFKDELLPLGYGSVVGILSYYGSTASNGTWQLLLRSADDCIGFSTDFSGVESNPWTVEKAISIQDTGREGWVGGYVVGAVAPEVTQVKSNADIEWTAPATLGTTLVIGPDPECTDYTKCLVVALPQGSAFRAQANLAENAEVYKTAIKVKGTMASYLGTYGITGNTGTTAEFRLSVATGGVTSINEGFESALPSDWSNIQKLGNKAWFQTTFNDNGYAAMTGYKGTAPFDSWLITPAINMNKVENKVLSFRTQVNGYGSTTSKIGVYVLTASDPASCTPEQLNATFATAPASGYSEWVSSGDIDLSSYSGTIFIGFRYEATSDANYATWCVDDVVLGEAGSGDDGGDGTDTPVDATYADFETFNNGTATGYYGTYKTTQGWEAVNCNILKGGETDSNPAFVFIGFKDESTPYFAACMNGKTAAVGSITSPVLSGGISKLSFNYGYAYSESNGISFKVDILQGGSVVKSFTVTKAASECAKYTAYEFSDTLDVKGSYQIVFTNLSPTNDESSNKDRLAIWNVNWVKN
ncbi:MAG: DUF5689 domain-containing protein [Muribaculaceae bacterium]